MDLGNATEAARRAGYKQTDSISQIAHENLRKPLVAAAIHAEVARIDAEVTPQRVTNRLHEISVAAQDAGQFAPAVRAEELLGKQIGMFVDRTVNVNVDVTSAFVDSLAQLIEGRAALEPPDPNDD